MVGSISLPSLASFPRGFLQPLCSPLSLSPCLLFFPPSNCTRQHCFCRKIRFEIDPTDCSCLCLEMNSFSYTTNAYGHTPEQFFADCITLDRTSGCGNFAGEAPPSHARGYPSPTLGFQNAPQYPAVPNPDHTITGRFDSSGIYSGGNAIYPSTWIASAEVMGMPISSPVHLDYQESENSAVSSLYTSDPLSPVNGTHHHTSHFTGSFTSPQSLNQYSDPQLPLNGLWSPAEGMRGKSLEPGFSSCR
jgi:hypothetical protein